MAVHRWVETVTRANVETLKRSKASLNFAIRNRRVAIGSIYRNDYVGSEQLL